MRVFRRIARPAVDPNMSHVEQGDPLQTNAVPGILDWWITTLVTAPSSFDHTIEHALIRMPSRSGTVMLQGQVPTLTQKRDASLIAKDTAGAERVENELVVAPRM
jgi:osmotically-inducible protein OsmY